MKAVFATLLALSAVLSCHCAWEEEFEAWVAKHNRHYASPLEEAWARHVWTRNMAYIREHNNRSDVTYTLAMNQFGDKFVRPPLRNVPKAKVPVRSSWPLLFQQPPPDSWDWRTKGVIPPVENQGSMGSSGAVAVTEVLESVHAIRTGQLLRLSVEEVVDCCTLGSGRMMLDDPYECIAKLGGLCSESSYPPAPSTKRTCRSKQCTAIVNDVNTTVHIKKGDEVAMMLAVLQVPLVVSVDASSPSFMFYKSGVYTSPDPSCGASLDHVMQVVGYGKDGEYWILKNSWGAEWGMQGYMLMKRGDNVCGVADEAVYPQ